MIVLNSELIDDLSESFKSFKCEKELGEYFMEKYELDVNHLEDTVNNYIERSIEETSIFHITPIVTFITLFFNIVFFTFNR